jgi:NADH dehydrogenase
MKEQKRKRVVILGGGFGGVYTALHLEKALRKPDDFEITLVNKENYFVFQPMLAEIVSGNIGILDTVSPIRRMLPRTDLVSWSWRRRLIVSSSPTASVASRRQPSTLFGLAVAVFAGSLVVLYFHRSEIPGIGPKLVTQPTRD